MHMCTHAYTYTHTSVFICVRRWVYFYLVDHDINIFFIIGHCEKDLKDPAKQDITALSRARSSAWTNLVSDPDSTT